MKIILISLIAFVLLFPSIIFAQTSEIDEIRQMKNEILDKIDEHQMSSGTVAQNMKDGMVATTNSIWYSSTLGTMIGVGIAIIGMLLAIQLTVKPVSKEEGNSRKYAWRWIAIGGIMGGLVFIFMGLIQTFLNF